MDRARVDLAYDGAGFVAGELEYIEDVIELRLNRGKCGYLSSTQHAHGQVEKALRSHHHGRYLFDRKKRIRELGLDALVGKPRKAVFALRYARGTARLPEVHRLAKDVGKKAGQLFATGMLSSLLHSAGVWGVNDTDWKSAKVLAGKVIGLMQAQSSSIAMQGDMYHPLYGATLLHFMSYLEAL